MYKSHTEQVLQVSSAADQQLVGLISTSSLLGQQQQRNAVPTDLPSPACRERTWRCWARR